MHYTIDAPAAATADVFDPSNYPRTYRVSMRSRVLYLLLGALVMSAGLFGAWYFATGLETETLQEAMTLTAVCLAFAILGTVVILYMFTLKVILYPDAIEVRSFLRAQRL